MTSNISYQNPDSSSPQTNPPSYQGHPQQIQQQYYYSTPLISKEIIVNSNEKEKYKSDNSFSVIFFIMGFFLFFPFFFNYKYLQSPHCKARKIALASLIVGTTYLLSAFITYSIFFFVNINNIYKCVNGDCQY